MDELVCFELDALPAEGEYVARITLGGTGAPWKWHAERRRYEAFVGPLPPLASEGGYGVARGHTTPFAGGGLPPRRPRGEG